MMEDAKRQRDGIVNEVENTRLDAIDKMRQLNSELDSQVDTGTAEILSTWDKLEKMVEWIELPKLRLLMQYNIHRK